jgi:hypothetical protein
MKKIFLIALAVAVVFCLPLTALAKADFELGGYIRMDAIWNSQQGIGHTLAAYPLRDIAGNDHGRFQMNASATRFNLTMKGPEVWGGKVTGFIEVDFDGASTTTVARNAAGAQTSWVAVNDGSFGQAVLRLRHAMFKINWPDREVLFGQYWSVNSEFIPDTADSGAYCLYGATQLRVPQVRYTQKFMDGMDASIAIASGQSGRWGLNVDAINAAEGETSETPMVEAKFRYEQDLYGKAGWNGKPRGFYVGLGAGYFRTRNVPTFFDNVTGTSQQWNTFGGNNFGNITIPGAGNRLRLNVPNQRYHDHWLFLIENFVPIIPTNTKSLAGTMSFAHQWWVGQGVSAWRLDLPGSDRYYRFASLAGANLNYDLTFIKRFGGWAQLQYYWTNEIFTNVNAGFMQAFDYKNYVDAALQGSGLLNNLGYVYGNPVGYDPIRSAWRLSVTQWYRPVSAVKFGLQYAYMRANYFQTQTPVLNILNVNSATSASSRLGDNHSLMANAWYMF